MITTLKNCNVCITGTLIKMKRSDAFIKIRKKGGNPQKKISKATDILVITNEALAYPTYKLFQADKWETTCIDENLFYQLIGV